MLNIEYFSKVRIACLTHLSGSFHPYWTTLIWLTLGGDHANMTRLFRSLGYIYIQPRILGYIFNSYIAIDYWLYSQQLDSLKLAYVTLLNNNEEKQDEEKHIAANISVVSAADGVV